VRHTEVEEETNAPGHGPDAHCVAVKPYARVKWQNGLACMVNAIFEEAAAELMSFK
jgi:hypothetical protein